MQLTTIDMIGNRVKMAKSKLSKHRSLGMRSTLSVQEVAKLMDAVKAGDTNGQNQMDSIFFSLN